MLEPKVISGQTLRERQNEDDILGLLAAQRYAYNIARQWQAAEFIAALSIASLAFLVFVYPNSKWEWVAVLLVGLIVERLNKWLFEPKKKHFVEVGARIQEQIDVTLFDIPYNDALTGGNVSPMDVSTYIRKFEKRNGNPIFSETAKSKPPKKEQPAYNIPKKGLTNWYPLVKSDNKDVVILLAQYSNIVWDKRQRNNYAAVLVGLLIIVFGAPITYALFAYDAFPLRDYLVKILVPSFPLYDYLLQGITNHWRLWREQDYKEAETQKLIAAIKNNKETITTEQKRELQDSMFKIRSTGNPVANWLYYWFRSGFEEDMQATADTLSHILASKN